MNIFLISVLAFNVLNSCYCTSKEELLVMSVATKKTDGFNRYMRSTMVNGLETEVLGMGETWKGGEMSTNPGGGQKINLLKNALEKHKNKKNLIVLFTDSYDVIITANKETILSSFRMLDARVVFGAEDFCWPDKNLKTNYPKVAHGYRFLNSGGFIGYAEELYKIVTNQTISDDADDQLYYTKIFLDNRLRDQLKIKLDLQATIFQNLNGAIEDVSLSFKNPAATTLENTVYLTVPSVIHGNGPSKYHLNRLGNYLAKSWNIKNGCLSCDEGKINMKTMKDSKYPTVLLAAFITRPVPFIEEFLTRIDNLNYPRKKLSIFLYNQNIYHDAMVSKWIKKVKENGSFESVKFISSEENIKEWHARDLAVEKSVNEEFDYYFNVDGEVHLDNPDALKILISYNRSVLAPMITRPHQWWATFWGAVNKDGFYARSSDYMDIVNYERRGIWNVPHITSCYLIQKKILSNKEARPGYINKLADPDIAFSMNFRIKDIFMYVVNLDFYGHLLNSDVVQTTAIHPDMWQVESNKLDWEERYLHPEYYKSLDKDANHAMPCPDVYWFPLFTKRFCEELVGIMENFGDWSGGKNEDTRLAGGYESVPTVDIHMNQVDYEGTWLYILKTYVKPLAEKVYIGYTSDARAIMNFVVRYRPDEQSFLRPHHDSSTYTINVGLNTPEVDYEGGGAHFIRFNCSVVYTKMGWALMHPGRLTHFHEGLRTTKGTRYIMVSFIDP